MISPDLTGENNLRFDSTGLGSGGSVRGVTLSPDNQYLYVTMATHTSAYEAGSSDAIAVNYLDEPIGELELLRLDAESLEVIDKLVLEYLKATDASLEGVADMIRFDEMPLEEKTLFLCFRDDEAGQAMKHTFNAGLAQIEPDRIIQDYFATAFSQ